MGGRPLRCGRSPRPEVSHAMLSIVLVSHGDLASALLRAATMIAGPQERVFTVEIVPGQSTDSLSQALADVLREIEPEPALVLVDLLGGTPYNVAARHALGDDVECVTGVNLPMLLEAIMSRDSLTLSEVVASITQAGRDSVRNLGPLLRGDEHPAAG